MNVNGFKSRVAPDGAAIQPSMTSNRRPAGQSSGSDNLSAIVAADRAFPAAVAELGLGGCTRISHP